MPGTFYGHVGLREFRGSSLNSLDANKHVTRDRHIYIYGERGLRG